MTAQAQTDVPGLVLSEAIREMTLEDHRRAEDSEYMRQLLGGQLDRDAYFALVGQLYFVYSALEDTARSLPADAQPFVMHELDRVDALERDLTFFYGTGWREKVLPLESTRVYDERLRTVAASWGAGFVAHHYTRYLGDLFGGQIIKRAVMAAYGLTAEEGVSFLTFPDIDRTKPFRDAYRALLDGAPWDDAEKLRLIEEVREAYRLNTALFAELDRIYCK